MTLIGRLCAFALAVASSAALKPSLHMKVSSGSSSVGRRELLGASMTSAAAVVARGAGPAWADEPSATETNQELLRSGVNPFNSACMVRPRRALSHHPFVLFP